MRISASLISRFHANRTARRALEGVAGSKAALDALDVQRKAIWADVHSQHNIPKATKLKVELDGAKTGELRDKNGRPYEAATATAAAAPAATGSFGVLNSDGTLNLFNDVAAARTYAARASGRSVHPVAG